jgi:hypothetical protein
MFAAGSKLAIQLEAEQLPAPVGKSASGGEHQLANGHQPPASSGNAVDVEMEDADVFAALAALADHAEQAS